MAIWRQKRFSAWQIEITTRCPLSCRMCIRQGRDWRNAEMSVERFAQLAPHLRRVETVILQGWGEPLLHRRLVDIVRLAKGAGDRSRTTAPSVGFVTSGKGMDRQCAADLVGAGLDFIGFSVAGVTADTHRAIRVHSELEEVVSAAQHVAAVKRERGLGRPRMHAVYLMLKVNIHEATGFPRLARRMGVDEIVLTNLVDVADAWQDEQRVFSCDGAEETGGVRDEISREARQMNLPVRMAPLSPALTPVCEEDPLRNLFVTVDGDVAPCVYLCPPVPDEFPRRFCGREHLARRVSFGNLFREPLDAIWKARPYVEFRERFARRARRHRLLCAIAAGLREPPGGSECDLPAPPEPCRTCHKMLGV